MISGEYHSPGLPRSGFKEKQRTVTILLVVSKKINQAFKSCCDCIIVLKYNIVTLKTKLLICIE